MSKIVIIIFVIVLFLGSIYKLIFFLYLSERDEACEFVKILQLYKFLSLILLLLKLNCRE